MPEHLIHKEECFDANAHTKIWMTCDGTLIAERVFRSPEELLDEVQAWYEEKIQVHLETCGKTTPEPTMQGHHVDHVIVDEVAEEYDMDLHDNDPVIHKNVFEKNDRGE